MPKKTDKKTTTSEKAPSKPGMLQIAKAWCIHEYERDQDDSSRALVNSLMLFLGGLSVEIAMTYIPGLHFTEARFWYGSQDYGRPSAKDLCEEGKSLMLAVPATVSETIAEYTEATSIVVGSMLTFTALMILSSKIGNPSAFPIPAGHFRTLFNFMRTILPVMATFFVPRTPAIGYYSPLLQSVPAAFFVINDFHATTAGLTFILAPLFEALSGVMNLFAFFAHKPIGDNFIPHPSKKCKEENCTSIVDTFYKTLWAVTTIARTLLAVLVLYIFYLFVAEWQGKTGAPQTDACGALRTTIAFTYEKTAIGLLGGYYSLLAVSQMCESSGRRVSSLVYILPLLYLCFKGIEGQYTKYAMTYDVKANYLALMDIPESGFWEEETFNNTTPGFEKCTFLLDLATVPDNCFELESNPQ